MSVTDWASLGTMIVTGLAFGTGLWMYWNQMNAQLFLAFTARYREVMRGFPNERGGRIDVFRSPPPESPDLTAAVVDYLSMCSEEFYIVGQRLLSRRTWRIWEKEIKANLASPLLLREWPKIKQVYLSFKDFFDFVDDAQRGAPT